MKKEKVNRACGVVFPAYCLELVEFGYWNMRNSYLSVDFLLKEKPTVLGLFVSKHGTYLGLTAKALTGPKWVESLTWSKTKSIEKQMEDRNIISL